MIEIPNFYHFGKTNLVKPNDIGTARPVIGAIGQSNLGTNLEVATDLEALYKQTYNNVQVFQHSSDLRTSFVPLNYNDNTSYQMPDQDGRYSLQFDLYTRIATQLNRTLHVVHHGKGNTGLAVEWKPTTTIGPQHTEIIYKLRATRNAIFDLDGIEPSFKFILSVHGEYDSRVEAYANAYQTNRTNQINAIRALPGLTNVPFIIIKVNSAGISAPVNPLTFVETVRTAEDNVAGALSGVYLVESNGAEQKPDLIHYTVAGAHTLVDRVMTVINNNSLLS